MREVLTRAQAVNIQPLLLQSTAEVPWGQSSYFSQLPLRLCHPQRVYFPGEPSAMTPEKRGRGTKPRFLAPGWGIQWQSCRGLSERSPHPDTEALLATGVAPIGAHVTGFSPSLPALPGSLSNNYLLPNTCLRLCFWSNPN